MTNIFDKSFENNLGINLKEIVNKNGRYYNEYTLTLKESIELLKNIKIPLKQLNDGSENLFHFEFYEENIFVTNNIITIPCSSITKTISNNYLIFPYIIPNDNLNIYLNTYYYDGREIQLWSDILFYLEIVNEIKDKKKQFHFIKSLNVFWEKCNEDIDKTRIIRLIDNCYKDLNERIEKYVELNTLGFFSILILYYNDSIKYDKDKFFEIFFDERKENRFNLNFSFSTLTINISSLNEFVEYVKSKFNTKNELYTFFEINEFIKKIEEYDTTLKSNIYRLISKVDKCIEIDFPSYEEYLRSENKTENYTVLRNLEKLTNNINFKDRKYKYTSKEIIKIHNFVKEYCKRINYKLRVIENDYRLERGYNIVGSLISETILYQKIKENFNEYIVISQGSPKWLSPQRLDIYFPDLNIGVEYQGDQHFKPVEYYGGEEGFKRTIERDMRKKYLCKRNGCILIEVLPNYDLKEVIKEIFTFIQLKIRNQP